MDTSRNSIRYFSNPDYLLRKIAEEAILVPTGNSAEKFNGMISLNDTCIFLWEFFQTPHTIQEAVHAAEEIYQDDAGTLESDIFGFVNESVKLGYFKEEQI